MTASAAFAGVRVLDAESPEFDTQLGTLLAFDASTDDSIEQTVAAVLADVRARGDAAVLDYTRRFDKLDAASMAELELPRHLLEEALTSLSAERRDALQQAAQRVRAYHERQMQSSWEYADPTPGLEGTRLGQMVRPLDRVGLYVPGGRAAYPSSVLMNAIPAKVAGVGELIMVVPTPHGERNPLVLAAAAVTGVDRVFTIGGAQAVAALAYGTASIAQVDKIVGPGNAYVASAKRRVFGTVGIDMVAGPSEVLIISDGHGDPDWVAMDMFAQAEHDELAQSLLLCTSAEFIAEVQASIARLLPELPRAQVIATSLANRGALIRVPDLEAACRIANRIAPEHLEVCTAAPRELLPRLHHAGAIFLGHYSVEALGDYCAGPNHVLPTMRSARFSSPLGVYDFQKRSSVIDISEAGAQVLGRIAAELALGEGLQAHARSASMRIRS
ncbi:MAG: histidinol dehydrogenase [Rhodocyclaceae bacterium]|nr:histidinol dehydrogenase [Rhodocyclaceae bacterium]